MGACCAQISLKRSGETDELPRNRDFVGLSPNLRANIKFSSLTCSPEQNRPEKRDEGAVVARIEKPTGLA
jgi:hypothetical protein